MKKFLPLLLFLLLCSFNRLDYNQITLGTPAKEVVQRYGEPYSVKELGKGILEYRYIERVSMNRELVYENHYYLRVQDGQVVSKRFREENRQPFDQMYRPDPNYPHYP